MRNKSAVVLQCGFFFCSIQGVRGEYDTMIGLIASSTCALVMLVVALIVTGLVVLWKDIVEEYYRKRGLVKMPPYKRKWLRRKDQSPYPPNHNGWDVPRRHPTSPPLSIVWRETEPIQSSSDIGLIYPPYEDDHAGFDGHGGMHHMHLRPLHQGPQPFLLTEVEEGKRSGPGSIARKNEDASQKRGDQVEYYVETGGATNMTNNSGGSPHTEHIRSHSSKNGDTGSTKNFGNEMAELPIQDLEKVTQF